MRGRLAVGAALALLMCCAACAQELTLHVPADVTASAVLVLIDGERLDAYAFSADQSPVREALRPAREAAGIELYLFELDRALEVLRLDAGWQALGAGGEVLPEPVRTRRSSIEDGAQTSWITAVAPERVRFLPLPRRAPACRTFRATSIPLPGTRGEHARFLLPLPDGSVLLSVRRALEPHRFYLVDRTGARQLPFPPELPGAAAVRTGDGAVWLVEHDGRVARGSLAEGFTQVATATLALGDRIWLAGAGAGRPDLYSFGKQGRLALFDGTAWQVLYDRPVLQEMSWAGIAWLGPGDVVAVGSAAGTALRYRLGSIEEVRVDLNPEDRLTTIFDHPDLGYLLGTRNGLVYTQDAGGFRVAGALPELFQVVAIAVSGGSVLFGGGGGALRELRLDREGCPAVPLAGRDLEFMRESGSGFALIQDNPDDAPAEVLFLDGLDAP